MYTSLIIYIGLFLAGYVIWKKYNDQEFYWSLYPVGGLLILSILDHLSNAYLQLSEGQRVIEYFAFTFLRIIAAIIIIFIILKMSFKNKKDKK